MIRHYTADDGRVLGTMLAAEGYKPEDMGFASHETWVYDDSEIKGFFTYRFEHSYPFIIHFCVDRSQRGSWVAKNLVDRFMHEVRDYKEALINVPLIRTDIQRIVEGYFKTTPYAIKDGYAFYKVEVGNGKYKSRSTSAHSG